MVCLLDSTRSFLLLSFYNKHQIYLLEDVSQFFTQGCWNAKLLPSIFPGDLCEHNTKKLLVEKVLGESDKPWLMLNVLEKFSIRSSWEVSRQGRDAQYDFKQSLLKGLPFKVSSLCWKKGITVGEILIKIKICDEVLYKYYGNNEQETVEQLFMSRTKATP